MVVRLGECEFLRYYHLSIALYKSQPGLPRILNDRTWTAVGEPEATGPAEARAGNQQDFFFLGSAHEGYVILLQRLWEQVERSLGPHTRNSDFFHQATDLITQLLIEADIDLHSTQMR